MEILLERGNLADKLDDILDIIQSADIINEDSNAGLMFERFKTRQTERKEQLQERKSQHNAKALIYSKTDAGKATRKRYKQSDKGQATKKRYEERRRIENLSNLIVRIEQGEEACVPYLSALLSGLIVDEDLDMLNFADVFAVIEKTIRVFVRLFRYADSADDSPSVRIYKEAFKALHEEMLMDFNINIRSNPAQWRIEYIEKIKEELQCQQECNLKF